MVTAHSAHRRRCREGYVLPLVAAMLTVLIGFVGYSIDGGVILTKKREAQAVADAAAMAAACVFYQNYQNIRLNNNGTFSYQSAATAAAQQVADADGFHNDAQGGQQNPNTSSIAVHFPGNFQVATSIYNTGTSTPSPNYDMNISDGCVEVVVHYFQPTYFTKVWGFNVIDVMARAVARGAWVSPKNGVLVLNYTVGASLTEKGGGSGGSLTVTGGSFVVDSNASNAAVDTGGGVITAPEFDVTGGLSAPASGIVTTPTANNIYSGLHPTPDPFAYLQPYATQQFQALTPATAANVTGTGTSGDPYVFQTGYNYSSIPSFSGSSTFVQFQGNGFIGFDLGNGSFNMTACTIAGQGVCIYMNTGSWTCSGTGGIMCGSFNATTGAPSGAFTGLTTGPMTGFTYYQPPSNTNTISITGNGGFNATGTFYAPDAMADIGGNGGLVNIGSQWVSNQMFVHGNGNVNINYNGPAAAKSRLLCLVE